MQKKPVTLLYNLIYTESVYTSSSAQLDTNNCLIVALESDSGSYTTSSSIQYVNHSATATYRIFPESGSAICINAIERTRNPLTPSDTSARLGVASDITHSSITIFVFFF